MRTPRFQKIIYGAGIIAAASLLLWQHLAILSLRAENAALPDRPSAASTAATDNAASPNPTSPQPANNQSPVQSDQFAELERLRAETADRKTEIEQARRELAQLDAADRALGLPFSFLSDNLPKSSWANSGYATPEAALQTMLWASRDGDLAALRASLTSSEKQRRAQGEWKGLTDDQISQALRDRLANATGIRILKYETLGPDTMHFTVYVDGYSQADQPIWMDIHRDGNEWRADTTEHHR